MSGCPIPDPGTPMIQPVCFPSTWAGLISESLFPQLDLDFWDDQATLADREAAQQTAAQILGSFLSPECTCTPACTPGNILWDFTIDEQGWILDGLGFYVPGVGWRAEIVDLTDGRHQQLNITTAVGGRPTLLGMSRFDYRVWGFPGERCPLDIAMYGYLNNVPVIEVQAVWNEAAHTTSLQVIGRTEWAGQSGGDTIDRLDIAIDVGPYNMALMTDVQFDVVRVYMEFCT